MNDRKILRSSLPFAALAAATMMTGAAESRDILLNYERLSSLEEPLSMEFGAVTLVVNGVLDSAVIRDFDDSNASGFGFSGNVRIAAFAQLPNRWRVGVTGFGQVAAGEVLDDDTGENTSGNLALSVGGVWGTVLAGNVSGTVREQTRRARGVGNAALAFDGFLGGLGDAGAGYTGRFGPWTIAAAVDGDGNVDFGAMSQRPHGTSDYRVTLRAYSADYAASGGRTLDTSGAGIVGELVHGSTTVDAGVTYERFASSGPGGDRWAASSGVRKKTGALSLSLEGHYGRIEDSDEVAAALGVQIDIARGLSVNFGVNHSQAEATGNALRAIDTEETKTAVSIRYSF